MRIRLGQKELRAWIKMQSKQHSLRKIQINVGVFPRRTRGEAEKEEKDKGTDAGKFVRCIFTSIKDHCKKQRE